MDNEHADHVVEPPRGAHPVQSPFKRHTVNEAMTGTYLVEIATATPSPDVDIQTINGHIDTDIYFLGGLPRRIGVHVQSTNGQIRLALPEQQHAQHLDVRVESVNGSTYLALPETYKGYLRLSSTNGSLSLGDALSKNSKLISGGQSKDITYYITPSSDALIVENEKGHYTELEDNCQCHSVSGSIRVGYYGTFDDVEAGEEDINHYAWGNRGGRECCLVA